jgi:hypothetical protein
MLGKNAVREIENVTLSDRMIYSRVDDMSHDAEDILYNKLKNNSFSILVVESIDFTNKSNVVAFLRCANYGDICENFLCYEELPKTNKDKIHLMSRLEIKDLSWVNCVGICTEGAHQCLAPLEITTLVKKENPDIITIHCFIHRGVLISKTLGDEIKKVLDDATKMINLSNKDQFTTGCLKNCKTLDKQHINLLHTEIWCLSRLRVFSGVFELKGELQDCFQDNNKPDFAKCFEEVEWLEKLAYLEEIFYYMKYFAAARRLRAVRAVFFFLLQLGDCKL